MGNNKVLISIEFDKNLIKAKKKLKDLNFNRQDSVDFKGLSGWVYEKTIQDCLKTRFELDGHDFIFTEQCKLRTVDVDSKGIIDLKIENKVNKKIVLIEIKTSGLFSANDPERYRVYNNVIGSNTNCTYLYITGHETCGTYKSKMQLYMGYDKSFFLDREDDIDEWERFVETIIAILT